MPTEQEKRGVPIKAQRKAAMAALQVLSFHSPTHVEMILTYIRMLEER